MDEQTIASARERGHEAAEAAANHAERTIHDWIAQACRAVLIYAKCVEGQSWMVESARAFAEANGLPIPPDKRAWGHVVRKLRAEGKITSAGYGSAASSNGSPKVRWVLA